MANSKFSRVDNNFHQRRMNDAKMGAYYTDVTHCSDIHKMFRFSEEEETLVLEPSIGDAAAVKAVTGVKDNPKIKIFGVELNDAVADATAKDPYMTSILQGDFLSEVVISNKMFSFCFANPPYRDVDSLEEERERFERADRIERQFLEKISNYMRAEGILVWVVPYNVFHDSRHLSCWMQRYETLAVYKFREAEYQKFKQIVVVGKRRHGLFSVYRENREAMEKELLLEKLEVLPTDFEESQIITVPPSPLNDLRIFRTKTFDREAATQYLKEHLEEVEDMCKAIGKSIEIPAYDTHRILRPPMPLKKANKAVLISCGIGSGLAGEDGKDLHLQRGSVREIEEEEVVNVGGKKIVKVRTRAVINLILVENNGTIRELI